MKFSSPLIRLSIYGKLWLLLLLLNSRSSYHNDPFRTEKDTGIAESYGGRFVSKFQSNIYCRLLQQVDLQLLMTDTVTMADY